MKQFDLNFVRAEIKKIVEINPKKLSACSYLYWNEDGSIGHCIVGQLLANNGVNISDHIPDCNNEDALAGDTSIDNESVLEYIKNISGITFTPEAISYLETLQCKQDTGSTWHEAFEDAESECI